MISRLLEKPLLQRKSFFLLGPRGTGKTFWVKSRLTDAIYIDLLNSEQYTLLLGNPARIVDLIPKNFKNWIIIDEIQRIPELLNEVHRLIEDKKNDYLFVLTGSSARKLRKSGVNLLAGRALVYHMHPLVLQEFPEQFDLTHALQYGMLPSVISEPNPKAYLKAYVTTYLREEVLQEGLTRNLAAFTRFLEIASLSQGQVLNMTNIASEIGIQQKMVKAYFEILEDLLLGIRIPVFTKRAQRQTIQHPKFYLFDTGVYQQLRPHGLLDSQAEADGAAIETLLLQSIRALNDYLELDYKIYFWRTVSGVEVDFILYGPHGFLAFEVKRSQNVSHKDAKGLRIFHQDYPSAKLFLIYGGSQRYFFDKVTVLPLLEALQTLPDIMKQQ